jgi:hypothetical protein
MGMRKDGESIGNNEEFGVIFIDFLRLMFDGISGRRYGFVKLTSCDAAFAYPGFYQSMRGDIATIDSHDHQSNCIEMQTTYTTGSL